MRPQPLRRSTAQRARSGDADCCSSRSVDSASSVAPADAAAGDFLPAVWEQVSSPALWGCVIAALAAAPPALAEGLAYNPEGGAELFKNVAGVAYIALVIFYFVRLFKRRADTATSQRIATPPAAASGDDSDDEEAEEIADAEVTPLQCFM